MVHYARVSIISCTVFPVTILSAALQRPPYLGTAASSVTVIDLTEPKDFTFFNSTTLVSNALNSSSRLDIIPFEAGPIRLNPGHTPVCNGIDYGYDISLADCANTLSRIYGGWPTGFNQMSWGQRIPELGYYDVRLPHRWSSYKFPTSLP